MKLNEYNLLQFKITVFYLNIYREVIYSCDGKAEFSASFLQSSVSHDSSEIILIFWFASEEKFMIIMKTANQHISMISEGSCDTEDWQNKN